MKYLVTGSSGHLGEALVRRLKASGKQVVSIDIKAGDYTSHLGSVVDRSFVEACIDGVDVVFHAATLHKPHVATHSRQDFVDTNITGTLNLLEAAREAKVSAFVFTSTTSVFGNALTPPPGSPAAWITEDVAPQPKNIYGVTKLAGENLCWLAHHRDGLNCLILRTSRFFPEEDDNKTMRENYSGDNAKVNELLYRRVDLEDVVAAHFLASERAQDLGFGRYIVSATSPFTKSDLPELRRNLRAVLNKYTDFEDHYNRLGWFMFSSIDRVYVNEQARRDLGWRPNIDFDVALKRMAEGHSPFSDLSRAVGVKGYHDTEFEEGPYPIN